MITAEPNRDSSIPRTHVLLQSSIPRTHVLLFQTQRRTWRNSSVREPAAGAARRPHGARWTARIHASDVWLLPHGSALHDSARVAHHTASACLQVRSSPSPSLFSTCCTENSAACTLLFSAGLYIAPGRVTSISSLTCILSRIAFRSPTRSTRTRRVARCSRRTNPRRRRRRSRSSSSPQRRVNSSSSCSLVPPTCSVPRPRPPLRRPAPDRCPSRCRAANSTASTPQRAAGRPSFSACPPRIHSPSANWCTSFFSFSNCLYACQLVVSHLILNSRHLRPLVQVFDSWMCLSIQYFFIQSRYEYLQVQ